VIASALILAGGSGTRFWPASRRRRPKQLLALEGERTLLQATVDRLAPLIPASQVWISTTAELVPEIRRQLPELVPQRILAEPCSRNTAPAIAWALEKMPPEARRGAVAVLPSDHRIGDAAAFRRSLELALRGALGGDRVVTLGVQPRWVETGFGYLELDSTPADEFGLRRVVRFREKPDRATAERFVASGHHLWNAGMFVFRGSTLLDHLRRLAPELAAGLAAIAADPGRETELYARLPAVSIDVAVMEKLPGLSTLPLVCGWDDLGSWQALFEVLSPDADGNRRRGAAVAVDSRDNLLVAESGTIAVLGVEGLVVVRSGDAVLVLPRDRAQEVRRIVERLEAEGRLDLL
jgi:mannose-1-phosphate guanylyltransferase